MKTPEERVASILAKAEKEKQRIEKENQRDQGQNVTYINNPYPGPDTNRNPYTDDPKTRSEGNKNKFSWKKIAAGLSAVAAVFLGILIIPNAIDQSQEAEVATENRMPVEDRAPQMAEEPEAYQENMDMEAPQEDATINAETEQTLEGKIEEHVVPGYEKGQRPIKDSFSYKQTWTQNEDPSKKLNIFITENLDELPDKGIDGSNRVEEVDLGTGSIQIYETSGQDSDGEYIWQGQWQGIYYYGQSMNLSYDELQEFLQAYYGVSL